ncbi:MAG: site-specific integrase [Fibrobacter sp.]|nr:site-specific integrase [Fibrobacter sp.]
MALEKIGPNKWRIKVCTRVKGIDYPIRKQELFEGTKTDAELRASEIVKAIRDRKESSLTVRTFSDILETYKTKKDKKSAPDLSRIAKLKKDLGHLQIEIFADKFEEYLEIVKNTNTVRRNPPNPATINRIVEMVRAAFNLAKKLDLVEKNPITPARFPKTKLKARDRYLDSAEQENLLNVIREHRPHILPLVEYSFLVPVRKGEMINLPKTAFNPFTNTIYVPDSKADIPIHKPVPEHMLHYFRNIPADCPYLFYRQDKNGKYYPLGDFRKAFKFCLKIAGLKDVRYHDTRHCAATNTYVTGTTEREIMDVAGWKTPMLSTYWHKNSLKSAQNYKFPVIKEKNGNGKQEKTGS